MATKNMAIGHTFRTTHCKKCVHDHPRCIPVGTEINERGATVFTCEHFEPNTKEKLNRASYLLSSICKECGGTGEIRTYDQSGDVFLCSACDGKGRI